ncbi:uncharacterized protein LOC110018403 [Phalaenopsis equestris]|uniref:uncharacterized protein LOC110018403 n=1 Tax=Phalaenopsis equestris TaxID=78828 RepID=UPI0009E31509|nr:uncharacterized protein LOC110018403 [Phalaenopsis equestris]
MVPIYELKKMQRVRRREFEHYVEIQGKYVNILEGLELHTRILSESDERKILDCVFDLRDKGRVGLLRKRIEGNPLWIIRHEEVDPIPSKIKKMIKRMVSWCILPADCVPNSCTINIYVEGACIPPHIDHRDFLRPFSIVSFISKCNILFGMKIYVVGPREFKGLIEIPLLVGSVLEQT